MTAKAVAEPFDRRRADVTNVFRAQFGRSPVGAAAAPGRVNLIGEHLDYNGGPVLPVAIDRSVVVAYAARADTTVCAYAHDYGQTSTFRLGDQIQNDVDAPWANYVRGVAECLLEAGVALGGVDLAIASNVPIGSGLSSSAALEVATAGAFLDCCGLVMGDKDLALLCQRAENDFVGVQCGIMDQLASVLCQKDRALLIDCLRLEWEQVPARFGDAGAALVVVDSGQRRRLEGSQYNRRRDECTEALRIMREEYPELLSLRDVELGDLRRATLPDPLDRRARHVITECERVGRAVKALRCGRVDEMGVLFNESHGSLRDDFDVSTPELDRLVALAQASPGVLGARLTGAGFGGCTVNLVASDALDEFQSGVVETFRNDTGLTAQMLLCKPSDGLRVQRL